jgi:hypothetical protein
MSMNGRAMKESVGRLRTLLLKRQAANLKHAPGARLRRRGRQVSGPRCPSCGSIQQHHVLLEANGLFSLGCGNCNKVFRYRQERDRSD